MAYLIKVCQNLAIENVQPFDQKKAQTTFNKCLNC